MMKKNITTICGSTRQNSTNHKLLKAIGDFFTDDLQFNMYEGLGSLPHFNPDSNEKTIAEVIQFKQLLNAADGIIICTPEYAHGVPGALKNAIDWTVSSCEFSHKPTALITASTDGRYGHAALLETLRVIEAKEIDQLQLLIPFAQTKVSKEAKISDERTLLEIQKLMSDLIKLLNETAVFPEN